MYRGSDSPGRARRGSSAAPGASCLSVIDVCNGRDTRSADGTSSASTGEGLVVGARERRARSRRPTPSCSLQGPRRRTATLVWEVTNSGRCERAPVGAGQQLGLADAAAATSAPSPAARRRTAWLPPRASGRATSPRASRWPRRSPRATRCAPAIFDPEALRAAAAICWEEPLPGAGGAAMRAVGGGRRARRLGAGRSAGRSRSCPRRTRGCGRSSSQGHVHRRSSASTTLKAKRPRSPVPSYGSRSTAMRPGKRRASVRRAFPTGAAGLEPATPGFGDRCSAS